MSTQLTKLPAKALATEHKKVIRGYAPITNFLKILANESAMGSDELSNAESLARKMWQKANTDDKDSLHWAILLLDRVEGKASQTIKVDNPNAIVEQLYTRLAIGGMSNEHIRNTLIGMGVDESLLPPEETPVKVIEVEAISANAS